MADERIEAAIANRAPRFVSQEVDFAPRGGDLIEAPPRVTSGRGDRLIPWEPAERIAKEARNGEFVLHDEGNDVCNIPYRDGLLVADRHNERPT